MKSEKRIDTSSRVVAHSKPGSRSRYAWYVLSAAVAMQTFAGGFGYYALSSFYQPWESEFGWTRGEISLAMSASGLLSGFLSPLVGRWTDKHGARKVSTVGALITGFAFVAMAGAGILPPFTGALALPFIFGGFMVLAFGRMGISGIPISTAVVNWFVKRRALALGIQSSGQGLGGVLLAPLVTILIMAYGWRVAFVAAGLLSWAVMLPFIGFAFRTRPSDVGLQPYGQEELATGFDGQVRAGASIQTAKDYPWRIGEVVRTLPFWCLSFAMGLFVFGNSAVLQHAIPLFTEKGESLAMAASLLGTIAALGIVGKLGSGYIADRMHSGRLVYAASFALQGLGIFVLFFSNSLPAYWLGVILIGLSMGGASTLQPVMLSECFGIASFGLIMGAASVVITLLNNLGPVFAGFMHDITGDYQIALITLVGLELVAGVAGFLARPALPRKGEGVRM